MALLTNEKNYRHGKSMDSKLVNIVDVSGSGRLFIFGDIHGCLVPLNKLIIHLEERCNITADDRFVFLGDYVDRGPEVKLTIDALLNFRKQHPKTTFLMGNHEDMMMSYLGWNGTRIGGMSYGYNGGKATLDSYGFASMGDNQTKIPEEHKEFFMSLPHVAVSEEYIMVHGGLDPQYPLEQQKVDVVMWIREGFYTREHDFGKPVVYGHTPREKVWNKLPYHLGIDTGCVFDGSLTCFSATERKLISCINSGSYRVVEKLI